MSRIEELVSRNRGRGGVTNNVKVDDRAERVPDPTSASTPARQSNAPFPPKQGQPPKQWLADAFGRSQSPISGGVGGRVSDQSAARPSMKDGTWSDWVEGDQGDPPRWKGHQRFDNEIK